MKINCKSGREGIRKRDRTNGKIRVGQGEKNRQGAGEGKGKSRRQLRPI